MPAVEEGWDDRVAYPARAASGWASSLFHSASTISIQPTTGAEELKADFERLLGRVLLEIFEDLTCHFWAHVGSQLLKLRFSDPLQAAESP